MFRPGNATGAIILLKARKHWCLLSLMLLIPLFSVAQQTTTDNSYVEIGDISFEGNKVTHERIIARELMFSTGDIIHIDSLESLLQQSRNNLLNTSLFNFVSYILQFTETEVRKVEVKFSFVERWYIWPWPIIEFADRNFNTWWDENRDLSRMSYGVLLKWDNFRGRKEKLYTTLKFGYNEEVGISYSVPYLNRKESLGLNIGIFVGRTKEAPVLVEENRLQYYKDDEAYVMKSAAASAGIVYRKEIYNTHSLTAGYNFFNFDDSLIILNPEYTVNGVTRLEYLSLSYRFKSDHRDYKPYPLEGHFFDLELVKRGLGILGDDLNVFYVLTTFRKYIQLGRKWYYASGLNCKFSNDDPQPFLMEGAIGYSRDIVRGYEPFVVHGQHFGILKNNLKFALIPTKNFDIVFLRSEKFSKVHYALYINAFFDMGFVNNTFSDPLLANDMENTLLYGYGAGLDFVTYYDLVFRFEYSFNKHHDQGFYIHFIAPI